MFHRGKEDVLFEEEMFYRILDKVGYGPRTLELCDVREIQGLSPFIITEDLSNTEKQEKEFLPHRQLVQNVEKSKRMEDREEKKYHNHMCTLWLITNIMCLKDLKSNTGNHGERVSSYQDSRGKKRKPFVVDFAVPSDFSRNSQEEERNFLQILDNLESSIGSEVEIFQGKYFRLTQEALKYAFYRIRDGSDKKLSLEEAVSNSYKEIRERKPDFKTETITKIQDMQDTAMEKIASFLREKEAELQDKPDSSKNSKLSLPNADVQSQGNLSKKETVGWCKWLSCCSLLKTSTYSR